METHWCHSLHVGEGLAVLMVHRCCDRLGGEKEMLTFKLRTGSNEVTELELRVFACASAPLETRCAYINFVVHQLDFCLIP